MLKAVFRIQSGIAIAFKDTTIKHEALFFPRISVSKFRPRVAVCFRKFSPRRKRSEQEIIFCFGGEKSISLIWWWLHRHRLFVDWLNENATKEQIGAETFHFFLVHAVHSLFQSTLPGKPKTQPAVQMARIGADFRRSQFGRVREKERSSRNGNEPDDGSQAREKEELRAVYEWTTLLEEERNYEGEEEEGPT